MKKTVLYISVTTRIDEELDDEFGYDFYVNQDTDVDSIESKIKDLLNKYERTFISIDSKQLENYSGIMWDTNLIEDCIKTYDI
jgi:flagellar capping protein FliD